MARRSRAASWTPALALLLAAAPASATEPIEEVAHTITADLGAHRATLVVRRTVRTSFSDDHEAHFEVRTGAPAVGAGLRTRGDDGRWYTAEVLPLAAAIETYWALTGSLKVAPERGDRQRFPSLTAKDPALLLWSPEGFDVYVFPVTQARPKTVEYTLEVPYTYSDGAYAVDVPVGGDHELAPELRIGAVARGYRVFVGGDEVRPGSVVAATTAGGQRVRVVPRDQPELAVRLASTAAGERHLVRVEVEAGPRLGPDPKDTHAVIVLDRSRSMTDSGADAARRAALDYLAHLEGVPGARAAVVAFDRAVVRLHEGFLSPSDAAAVLRAAPAIRANGSDLAGAVASAAELLRGVKRAPRRVLILSDTAIDPAAEVAVRRLITDSRAIVHVADVEDGSASWLAVDDGHRWRDVVVGTGGLVWRGKVDLRAAGTGEAFAEWVRPGAVRELTVTRDGLPLAELELPRGEGAIEVDLLERAPQSVRATGRLWGRTIALEGRRAVDGDREWTSLAAAYVDDAMSDAEIVDVATRARAASPRTALLALEPAASPGQAAPSSEPKPVRWSSGCRLRIGGQGGFGRHSLEFDEGAFIRQAVVEAASACRARHREVAAELTTTYAEVLAVSRVEVPDDPRAAACISDRLWALEFPPGRDVVTEHVIELDGA